MRGNFSAWAGCDLRFLFRSPEDIEMKQPNPPLREKPRTWLALPGALGGPADWMALDPWLGGCGNFVFWDWHGPHDADWDSVVAAFAAVLREHPRPWGVLGYSQGGRAALAALAGSPDLFAAAGLIGVHPGLEDEGQRLRRAIDDEEWAVRAESGDWSEFLDDWNLRGTLADGLDVREWDPALAAAWRGYRAGLEAHRVKVADAMRKWSLARQPDFWGSLAGIQVPVLWINGERDGKFCKIGERACGMLPAAEHVVIAGAGHRVPWEKPEEFGGVLRGWW